MTSGESVKSAGVAPAREPAPALESAPGLALEPAPALAPAPSLFARLLILFVRLYQLTLSHLLGGHCRFQPSCSNYALAVLRSHGAFEGTLRAARRVSKCHPFHPGGYDPPPPPPPTSPRRRAR